MAEFSENRLSYGQDEPLPEMTTLRAGPLTMLYDRGELRHIKLGEYPVLHQIYAAVRDHNWGTVPGELTVKEMDVRELSFRIVYEMHHQQDDIDFEWTGTIIGGTDGTVKFTFDGKANSTFKRNRVGFCVLHPMQCAGQPCSVEHVDGNMTQGYFPELISPHQPFFDLRAITHEVTPGTQVRVLMEGDTFEMEDQRNWTDASYKTYCTPLSMPFPATVEAGDKIHQEITITLGGEVPTSKAGDQSLTFDVNKRVLTMPGIGLEVASHGEPLTDQQIERLKALNLGYLRVDLYMDGAEAEARLKQAAEEAEKINTDLEIAVFVTDEAEDQLKQLNKWVEAIKPPVVRWLIFHTKEKTTQARWVKLAEEHLTTTAPIGAGTDAFFTELNRERPPLDVVEFVTYSLNPQVHAFDNLALVETLPVQGVTLKSARAFSLDRPISISPVTLKMRWNPNATGPQPETPPGELPPQVDERQMSLFNAGWTLGSIKYLVENGADSLTYHETTGWRGIMATEDGSPLPEKFKDIPGGVYPVYHVFAAIAPFSRGEMVKTTSSDPLRVDGVLLRKNKKSRLLLANYTGEPQKVAVRTGYGDKISVKSLDTSNTETAMRDPEAYQEEKPTTRSLSDEAFIVELAPYAFVIVNLEV